MLARKLEIGGGNWIYTPAPITNFQHPSQLPNS